MAIHETVLRHEAADALVMNPGGCFVDCTYGRGGHSQAILEKLNASGRLMMIDRDQAAIAHARQTYGEDGRVTIIHGAFSDITRFVNEYDMHPLHGVLLDLGVSSPQLDEAGRGFSFYRDGPLDMRMDQSTGESAAAWLMRADEREIAQVIWRYGEERFARRIARAIVSVREVEMIETTGQLARIVEDAVPKRERHKHPATRTFQAIRIFVNKELDQLESCLKAVVDLLVSEGRLVVISFHSLEDRIVKRFMRDMARGERLPDRLPVRDADIARKFRLVGKPVKPSETEVSNNRRARSSIMRVAEKQ